MVQLHLLSRVNSALDFIYMLDPVMREDFCFFCAFGFLRCYDGRLWLDLCSRLCYKGRTSHPLVTYFMVMKCLFLIKYIRNYTKTN